MKKKQPTNIQYAACVFEISSNAAGEIQLLPYGQFRATDGRPFDAPFWLLNDSNGPLVVARAQAKLNKFVIDYEHQTLHTETNGQPAPAAGWFKTLEYRSGIGLFSTDAEWTPRAAEHIAAKEYLYISAVFAYLPTGEVLNILHAALTNNPGLDGMSEVAQRAAARYAHETKTQEESPVNEEQLKLLGLSKDATEEQITAAIAALSAKAADATAQVAALTAAAGKVDPAKYVPVAVVDDLRTEIAALTAKVTGDEVDALVTAGLSDGRLLPAQEQWARDLGKASVASLKSYLETATPIAALRGTQTGGAGPAGGGDGALSDVEIAACRALGMSHDEYKTGKA